MLQRILRASNVSKLALKKMNEVFVARYASENPCKDPKKVFKSEITDGRICKGKDIGNTGAKDKSSSSACTGNDSKGQGKGEIYRKIFFYVCLPIIIYKTYSDVIVGHEEPERGPCIDYDYMGILNKPYMWGDGRRTAFHNPKKNYLPHCEPEDDDDAD